MSTRQEIHIDPQDKQRIATILSRHFKNESLQHELIDSWVICDHDPRNDLYMVHYKDNADIKLVGLVRGVVVDLAHECVLADSYGATHVINTNEIHLEEGHFNLEDIDGQQHQLKPGNVIFRPCFDGALIRVFYYNGHLYIISHRRFNVDNISYYRSPKFGQMVKDLQVPTTELFKDSKKYSPHVYFFLMIHPDLLQASKFNVGQGFVVDLGHKVMWSADDCPLTGVSAEDIDYDHVTVARKSNVLPTNMSEPILYCPAKLTVEQINYTLTYGSYSVVPGQTGTMINNPAESVVGYVYDDDDNFIRLIKLHSSAYTWRLAVRGTTADPRQRFYELTTEAAGFKVDPKKNISNDDLTKFFGKFPTFQKISPIYIKQMLSQQPILCFPTVDSYDDYWKKEDLLYILWVSLIMAVPIHLQPEVSHYLDEFYYSREHIINWLTLLLNLGQSDYEKTIAEYEAKGLKTSRIEAIIKVSRENLQDKIIKLTENGKVPNIAMLTKSIIRNYICKERGRSLYSLRRIYLALHPTLQQ